MYNFYKRTKFHNKKTEYNGMVFDSKKELNRYCELQLLQKAHEISDLHRQVKFVLIPKQMGKDGKVAERECCYIADFAYKDKNGDWVVEDVKGIRTPEYTIKRKLMLYVHHIKIIEI